jgi:hypothetical protein
MTAVVGATSLAQSRGPRFLQSTAVSFFLFPSATTEFRGRIKAKSTPYTVTAILPLFKPANFLRMGLFLTDGTKLIVSGLNSTFQRMRLICVSAFTNAQNVNADSFVAHYEIYSSCVWMRIADDGATRTYSISNDNVTYVPVFSDTHTTFLTPTSAGFGANVQNSVASGMLMLSWVES